MYRLDCTLFNKIWGIWTKFRPTNCNMFKYILTNKHVNRDFLNLWHEFGSRLCVKASPGDDDGQ